MKALSMYLYMVVISVCLSVICLSDHNSGTQGIGIKGREMALVWHEKASRTALQTSSVLHMHTLLVQTHNMTTVKEIFLEFL